jgi:hypothetical protein
MHCVLTAASVLPLPPPPSSDSLPSCVHCRYPGDIGILLAGAWFEQLRSPALGAALSLLAELPASQLYRWHALACCGQATSAGQALVQVGPRAALLTALHVAVWWWAPSTLPQEPRAGRATKLKVA